MKTRPGVRITIAIVVPMIVALALRLYRFDELSIWLDEGSTIHFARLPWLTVLGFDGRYDTHPPLYYGLVKVAGILGPEVATSRLLSVVAGAISVGLIAGIGVAIRNARTGFVAGMAAAVAPLLIWYSQEARQYAATSVAVLLAYLCIVVYSRDPRVRWAVLYAVSLACALYLDYSALYPLLPHVVLLAMLIRRRHAGALPMIAAAGTAALAFVPWLPVLLATAQSLGESRSSFLGLTFDNVVRSAGAVIGNRGWGEYFATSVVPPIIGRSDIQVSVAAVAVAAAGLALVSLRRDMFVAAVIGCLLAGTIGTAALLSLVSPGLAPRTVSYAAFGWALIVAIAITDDGLIPPLRFASRAIGLGFLLMPLLVLGSLYSSDKDHWRDLARDTHRLADATGFPVVIHPLFAQTLIDTYEPAIHEHELLMLGDDPDVSAVANLANRSRGLILAFLPTPRSGELGEALEGSRLGVLVRKEYRYGLWLELWAAPGVELGAAYGADLAWDDGFWVLPEGASELVPDTLVLADSTPAEEAVVKFLPEPGGALFTLTFTARLTDPDGLMRAFVICASAANPLLEVAPDGWGRSVAPDGEWHLARIAALCPRETQQVRLDLRNAGPGSLELRALELRVVPAP